MMQRPGDSGQLEIVQFAIRVAEHRDTAADLVEQILRAAGYSAQTFGQAGDTAATATEVVAREGQSFKTRNRKIVYWRPALRDALDALLAVDKAVYRTAVTPEFTIEFADAITEDPQTVAGTVNLLRAAEAASTETIVRRVNPEWTDEQVTAEVQRIHGESGRTVPDPMQAGLIA
jgi:hypothetical protein